MSFRGCVGAESKGAAVVSPLVGKGFTGRSLYTTLLDAPTLADGWAYARCYTSEAERRGELDSWLHNYNHHRPHTACGNQPPFSRLINVPGQYR